MMATRRTPRSMRNKKKKRNEFELEDDDDNVDLANEEVDPFGGRATTEELKEYGSFGAYHEEYQDATQNVDERPAAPTKPTKPKVSKVGVDEDTEFDPYKRTIFGVGEEGEMLVHGVTIPDRFKRYFYESEAERVRRMKRKGPTQEEKEAEERYRKEEALMMRQKPLSTHNWKRDGVDYPFTRRQRRVSVLLEQALNDSSAMLGKLNLWFGDVEVSASMRTAKIRWNCAQQDQTKIAQYQRELQRLAPQLRYAVTQSVSLKYSPELVFVYDDGTRERTRMETEAVLERLEKLLKKE